jgi:biopolymer transport protein ExbB/TolQ
MDEDILVFGAVLLLFISWPVSIAVIVTSCVAYSRTKEWDRKRNLKEANLETNRLVDSNSDDESDFLDTDDENDYNARKAEELAESHMTFNQMWRKQFRKVWNGKGAKQVQREKEREERRKLAKAVARELDRRERRRAREAATNGELGDSPPAYHKE